MRRISLGGAPVPQHDHRGAAAQRELAEHEGAVGPPPERGWVHPGTRVQHRRNDVRARYRPAARRRRRHGTAAERHVDGGRVGRCQHDGCGIAVLCLEQVGLGQATATPLVLAS